MRTSNVIRGLIIAVVLYLVAFCLIYLVVAAAR
jgi:hypothetical protein